LNRYLKLTQELDDQKTYSIMLEALNVMKRVADGINNFLPPVNKVLNTIDMKKLIETYGEVIKEVRKVNLSLNGQNLIFLI
jgi:hypothetical protein